MLRPRLTSPVQLVLEAPRPSWEQLQYGVFAFLCAAGFVSAATIAIISH